MSRAPLNKIPGWPARRVACVVLSSVRPGKSRSRERCPTSSKAPCSTFILQDRVAVHSQDVVETAHSQTFSKEGELCLRVLAELDAFVHCADDISLAQELVRDELLGPNSDSECDATVGCCRDFGQAPRVADSTLGWRCIQIIHEEDDFCFQWVPLRSDSGTGNVEVLKKRLSSS